MRHVRRRVADDLHACVTVLLHVHTQSSYPGRWPANPAAFLSPPGLVAAWVVESAGTVVGHVMLCHAPEQMGPRRWSELINEPQERIGLIRQLFVSPDCQGKGLGTMLLDTATAAAQEQGLVLALDVLDSNQAAIALYEARGWIRLATDKFTFADEATEPIHYYRGP